MSIVKRIAQIILLSFLLIVFFSSSLFSQNINLTVGNTSGENGDSFIPLDIKFSNLSDTISAFQLWLQIDNNQIVRFQSDLSNQYQYDTSSFIMPSWHPDIRSLGGFGNDLLITVSSNFANPSYIMPPQNDDLLIRLYLKVDVNIQFPPEDSTANIMINSNPHFNFNFTNNHSQSIGLESYTYTDSACYSCLQWDEEICLLWEQVPNVIGVPLDTSLCDSMDIFLDTSVVLDSSYWQFIDGTFTLLPTCGYSLDYFDITNLVALVDFMFTNGPVLSFAEADYDCNCMIDISDLVGFVDFMFTGGPAPGCPTE